MQTYLGKTVFCLADCREFGNVSGDLNPLHIDELYARKSIAGNCVVHGVLVLLHALGFAFASGVPKPSRINAQFRRFICVGDEVNFSVSHRGGKSDVVQVSASVGNSLCVGIVLYFSRPQPIPSVRGGLGFTKGNKAVSEWETTPSSQEVALDEPPGQYLGRNYAVDLSRYRASDKFQDCVNTIGALETHALFASTYFIGMVCPGLNSIFSSLDVEILSSASELSVQNFCLNRFDERVGRYEISTHGILMGKLTAFKRPEAAIQEHISTYQTKVKKKEFSNLNALVVGGSRGLGAAAAKILSLGDAEVTITFAKGKADAEMVASEIENFCGLKTGVINFDLNRDNISAIENRISLANAVLYFATPKIRAGTLRGMDKQLFDTFFSFYVEKLLELCLFIENLKKGQKIIYVPSSMFVESRPRGYIEYAMAKSAAEILCNEINSSFSYVRLITTRLPQLKTDQTASLYVVKYESIFDNLYPVLKSISGYL